MKTYRLHLNFTIELDGSLPDFSCEFLQPSNEMAGDYAKKILGLMARHIPTIDGGLLLDETEKHAVEYAITRKPAIVEIRIHHQYRTGTGNPF